MADFKKVAHFDDCVDRMIAIGWNKNTSTESDEALKNHFPKPSMMIKHPQ